MKKKSKTGAYVRWSGRNTVPQALLVETRAPAPDTPAAFVRELDNDAREPWGHDFWTSRQMRNA